MFSCYLSFLCYPKVSINLTRPQNSLFSLWKRQICKQNENVMYVLFSQLPAICVSARINGQVMRVTEWWKESCMYQTEQIQVLVKELKMACMYSSQIISCLSLIKFSQLSQLGNEDLNSSTIRPSISTAIASFLFSHPKSKRKLFIIQYSLSHFLELLLKKELWELKAAGKGNLPLTPLHTNLTLPLV